jgi:YVTN family beta-propeller protein
MLAAAEAALIELAATPAPTLKQGKKKRQKASTKRRLKLVKTITGGLSPKSIVADQRGRYYAMNMMYNHTITVFNRRYKRVKTIDDSIDLSKYGYRQFDEKVQGAPVEAAVSPDRKRIYVSNYSMYGPGFRNQGFDLCKSSDRIDRGFVYEINTRTLRKTDAIQVGDVPKYLAVSPDGRYLLVGNWCSWDISVVDLRKNKEIRRIDAGVAPRGIAFSPNSKTAYVTLVGEDRILVIDMKSFKVRRDIAGIGERPRHLVMSPNGRYLYITVQGKDRKNRADGRILKYDTRRKKIVTRSKALVEPRTTVMSDDGKSLYVVDYYPGTLVKLRTGNLKTIQDKYLGYHPIGVTYDNASDKLWVSGYGGSVWVLKDR